MWKKSKLSLLFGVKVPIIQAPMAGGATTPELVASVSNGGGLGSLGAGYLSASELRAAIVAIRQLTQHPFAVNLFIPEPHIALPEQMIAACHAINNCASRPSSSASAIDIEPMQGPYSPVFSEQVRVLLEEKIPIVSFTFGLLDDELIEQFKLNNTLLIGTATTLAEAHRLQKSRVDAIVAQGSEAGGHRGSFLAAAEQSLVPVNTLLTQMVSHINLPIIASGGVMTGKAIFELMQMGASAVQLGTAFLCCDETGIAEAYKTLLLNQTHDTTILTRAFSGKLARGVANQFTRCMQSQSATILDYPIQNKLTGAMRNKAKAEANTDDMSLWAGQSVYLARQLSAGDLLVSLISEADDAEVCSQSV